MGNVINLDAARTARRAGGRRPARATQPVEFYFDLADAFAYLAAERVDRCFGQVVWIPASAAALHRRSPGADGLLGERRRRGAEIRSLALRMPLQWPERYPAEVPGAMRAAAHAAELGRGGAFALAAGRLAFCGGFDLEDPEILAEAAAAAGIGLDECLAAARDSGHDGAIEAAGRRLLALGADDLPVLRTGRTLAAGEERISALAAAARARLVALGH